MLDTSAIWNFRVCALQEWLGEHCPRKSQKIDGHVTHHGIGQWSQPRPPGLPRWLVEGILTRKVSERMYARRKASSGAFLLTFPHEYVAERSGRRKRIAKCRMGGNGCDPKIVNAGRSLSLKRSSLYSNKFQWICLPYCFFYLFIAVNSSIIKLQQKQNS